MLCFIALTDVALFDPVYIDILQLLDYVCACACTWSCRGQSPASHRLCTNERRFCFESFNLSFRTRAPICIVIDALRHFCWMFISHIMAWSLVINWLHRMTGNVGGSFFGMQHGVHFVMFCDVKILKALKSIAHVDKHRPKCCAVRYEMASRTLVSKHANETKRKLLFWRLSEQI